MQTKDVVTIVILIIGLVLISYIGMEIYNKQATVDVDKVTVEVGATKESIKVRVIVNEKESEIVSQELTQEEEREKKIDNAY